MKTTKFWSLIN